jgi:predicted transcriptional regulator
VKIKKIRIKSTEQFDNELRSVARAFDRGKTANKPLTGDFFESLDAVRSVLTDKRLELWRIIRDQKPDSISSLAEIVERDFRGVHRDVKVLELMGLISLKKTKGKRGDLQHPVSLADKLILSVA